MRRRNPTSMLWWTLGLAAGGVALVGGVAYAATRGSAAACASQQTLAVVDGGTYSAKVPSGGTLNITTPGGVGTSTQPGGTGVFTVNVNGVGGPGGSLQSPGVYNVSWSFDGNVTFQKATVNVTMC